MRKRLFVLIILFSSQGLASTPTSQIRYLDDNENSSTGARGTLGRPGQLNYGNWDGKGSCENVPETAKTAFREAKRFMRSCSAAAIAPGKMIAVNDYSGSNSPKMYIFDQNGDCRISVPVSWGSGAVPRGSLKACSEGNSNQTPPGFHITAPHNGTKYQEHNSVGLAGLSGQNSLQARGVLIHASGSAGTGTSWGCSSVPTSKFLEIKQTLGYGSLVYNYFGNVRSDCPKDAGFPPPSCEPEATAIEALSASRRESGLPDRPRFRNWGLGSGSESGSTQEGSSSGGSR